MTTPIARSALTLTLALACGLLAAHHAAAQHDEHAFGPRLPLVADLHVGPTMYLARSGSMLYAIGRSELRILDASDPAHPKLISRLPGLGNVRQIAVRDGLAYITAREDGLFIVDVKDPASPRLLTHYDTIELATGICLSGPLAFVACRNYGVELIDITHPASPRHLSTVRTGEAQSVIARDGILYVGVWGTRELVIVDVHNPAEPRIISTTKLDGYGDGVDLHGNLCFVATGHHSAALTASHAPGSPGFGQGHGLEIFDVADPAHPKLVSRIKAPPLYSIGRDMWSVSVADRHAFVADTHNGVFVIDITNPAAPRFVAHHQLPKPAGKPHAAFVGGLSVGDNHLYVAGGDTDLHVLAAPGLARIVTPDPDHPPRITPVTHTAPPGWQHFTSTGQVHAVTARGPDIVVASGHAGVQIVDGDRLRSITAPPAGNLAALTIDLAAHGQTLFTADALGGFNVYRLNGNLDTPIATHHAAGRAVRQIVLTPDGARALIAVGENEVQILDTSDPTHLRPLLSDKHLGLLYGDQITPGLVEGRYASAFWHVTGLFWYDLADPAGPKLTPDHYDQRWNPLDGATPYRDGLLIIHSGKLGLAHRSDTALPPLVAVPNTRLIGKPTVFENLLFVSDRAAGTLTIIDIADFQHPRLLKQHTFRGNPGRVVVTPDRTALIPAGYEGLYRVPLDTLIR